MCSDFVETSQVALWLSFYVAIRDRQSRFVEVTVEVHHRSYIGRVGVSHEGAKSNELLNGVQEKNSGGSTTCRSGGCS